jgi:hypothetical protein
MGTTSSATGEHGQTVIAIAKLSYFVLFSKADLQPAKISR